MNGINKTLFEQIEDELDLLKYSYNYPLKDKIKEFLELEADDYERRQNLALDISSEILQRHSKEHLPWIANKLANLERNLQDIQPYQRDHVCHSLLTFLLGFVIIIKLGLAKKYHDFHFQWKLAGTLHDVGYPLEITDSLNRDFFSDYDENVLEIIPEFNPMAGNYLTRYLELYTTNQSPKRNILDIINLRLQDWKIKTDAKEIFLKMIKGKKIDSGQKRTDHGITSAILVMKAIDRLYEKVNPNQTINNSGWTFSNMENQITNVCASIFVHNINKNSLQWNFNDAPLATLLKLCDELQDWSRPKKDNEKGELPTNYNFKFENEKLIFLVNKQKKNNIEKKIGKVINFPISIEILSS